MRMLSIDMKTYSSIDLMKAGVYAYISASDFECDYYSKGI